MNLKTLKILCASVALLCACDTVKDMEKSAVEQAYVTLICINDYQYYFIRKDDGGLAPRLNADGTPCPCSTEADSLKVKFIRTSK